MWEFDMLEACDNSSAVEDATRYWHENSFDTATLLLFKIGATKSKTLRAMQKARLFFFFTFKCFINFNFIVVSQAL